MTTEPARLDASELVRQRCAEWLTEAGQLRAVELPAGDAVPDRFYETMLVIRANLDRMEGLLEQAMMLKSGTAAAARDKEHEADDAWDTACQARSRSGAHREFEGAKERYADINLDTLAQRRAARAARRLADQAADTCERLRLMHRGLDSARQDVQSALRHHSWLTTLDR